MVKFPTISMNLSLHKSQFLLLLGTIGFAAFLIAIQPKQKPYQLEPTLDLGKALFFDPILSLDSTISCSSCHQPQFAFADSTTFSKGVGDSLGIRNTPSVMNMALRPYFFYDGRAATLEEQAKIPIENPVEMHLDFQFAVERISRQMRYQKAFQLAYQAPPDSLLILASLANFIRSLESQGEAPHDQWLNDVNPDALTASQLRGRDLFIEEAKCFDCHFGPDFTGDEFRNIGLYDGTANTDLGRFNVTQDSNDLGKFKVPGLRNVALTAPYMHDGSLTTLEEVVEYYDDPTQFVSHSVNLDTLMEEPLNLTDRDKSDLVNFLHSLTDPSIPYVESNEIQESQSK